MGHPVRMARLWQLYFLAGDTLATAGIGALVAIAVTSLLQGWGYPAMATGAGTVLGLLVAFLALGLLIPLFGAFEVMLPAMVSGMLVGMATGIRATTSATSLTTEAGVGAALGLAVMLSVRLLDWHIRHQKVPWTS